MRKSWRKHEDRSVPAEDLPLREKAPGENIELRMDVMDLPEKYRDVVLLVYWQRMTIREAARAVSASEATVCRRLQTARSMIGA